MKPSFLSWICSFLTLHSVASADEPPSFTDLPNEVQLAIMDRLGFCDYVESLKVGRGVPTNTDVGMAMLAEVAEEERTLNLEDDRFHSELPIGWKKESTEELERWAKVFESSYEGCASYSESPTWKKACMVGLFGSNTLVTLLPHLSEDFCSHNKVLLLQTAFFIGDIGSLKAIVEFFDMSNDEVLAKVPERDIVFSGSVPFIEELFEILPRLMEKRLGLIREACSLNRLDILLRILDVAKPAECEELSQLLVSFWRLLTFENQMPICITAKDQAYKILQVAAQHGYLPIIRFLWPAMKLSESIDKRAVKDMMFEAGWNSHRSVLEFLLFESGALYVNVAQRCVNSALRAAVKRGNVDIVEFLTGKHNDGTFVSPGLCLAKLDKWDFEYVIKTCKNWNGIQYLVDLKKKGDSRFANFELVDQDNTALCYACEVGNYKLVEDLLCKTDDGEFVFPLTNPAARNNKPLVNACWSGNLQIVEKLLERDLSGKYIYKGIDPSARSYESIFVACSCDHLPVVKLLLKMKDGKYVFSGMDGVDLTRALSTAIGKNRLEIVRFLLKMKNGAYVLPEMNTVDLTLALSTASELKVLKFLLAVKNGTYVLPGMNGVDFTRVLSTAIECERMEIVQFLLKMRDGKYVLPRMNGVDFTRVLSTAIGWSWNNRDIFLEWLLSTNKVGEYVLLGMNGVNFTRVLSTAIELEQIYIVRFLLKMRDGKYVLPGMNGVNFTSVLSVAIEKKQSYLVKGLLRMKKGEHKYVLPGMNDVDLTPVLKSAILSQQKEVVELLLRRALDGSYLHPGVGVTRDMLTIPDICPGMREL